MTTGKGVLEVGGITSSPASIIGRQRELALIWNQYEAAKDGQTRVVLVTGEPGIGKTRILSEITRRAIQDGAIALHGGASDAEGMPPYQPFLEALGGHIRTVSPDYVVHTSHSGTSVDCQYFTRVVCPPGRSYGVISATS